jgi:hypothetical protein
MQSEETKEGIMECLSASCPRVRACASGQMTAHTALKFRIPEVHPRREFAIATSQQDLMIDVRIITLHTSFLHSIYVSSFSLNVRVSPPIAG